MVWDVMGCHGVVWYGLNCITWHGLALYGMAWHGMAQPVSVHHSVGFNGTVWYGTAWPLNDSNSPLQHIKACHV